MKQVFLDSAQLAQVVDVDVPAIGPTDLLVAARASLISTGTETAGYDSGGLVTRGLRDPSRIGVVLDSVREHGVEATRRKIAAKKEQMLPRGYSGAGVVVAVGAAVRGLGVGDRVAYAGAPHAEYVTVAQNLAARIPAGVSYEEAAFGALACIALHGVRLGEPTLGEQAMVVGLGLVGLLAAQFARAAGLGVLGVEPVSSRRAQAVSLGIADVIDPSAEEAIARTAAFHTGGTGVDIVYLCAGIRDSRVTNDAMAACRDRGRVVMIGDMGLELDRKVLFSRELEFRVSRSYGPGRYAPEYEGKGLDYPIGYVRWTEGRNLEAFLAMLAAGSISVRPLISAVLPVAEAASGYRRLVEEPQSTIAVILSYDGAATRPAPQPIRRKAAAPAAGELNVAVIGAGSFVTSNLLPHLRALRGRLYGVANRSANAFATLKAQYGPEVLTTSALELINDPSVHAVIIGTRHNLHAELAAACVRAGKPVHVEKPMAMTLVEAEALAALVREHDAMLTVGFNRRFAPTTQTLRHALAATASPRQFLYRVNAPPMPANHWSLDPLEGGGRLVGEGCHFIDLVCYLSGSEVTDVSGRLVGGGSTLATPQDNFAVTLRFANGDLGTVVYSGQGNAGLAKERLEVFANGHAWVLDDFESLEAYGGGKGLHLKRADKGFRGHLGNFLGAVRGEVVLETTVDDGVQVARVIEMLLHGSAT